MGDEESCCGACAYLAEGPHDVVRSRPLLAHAKPPTVTLVIWHAGNVRRIPLAHAARLVIGRDRAADIAIEDPMLSRRTCCLDITPSGEVYVEDLASACGTIVNDGRVNRARLHEADTIRIGRPPVRDRGPPHDARNASVTASARIAGSACANRIWRAAVAAP